MNNAETKTLLGLALQSTTVSARVRPATPELESLVAAGLARRTTPQDPEAPEVTGWRATAEGIAALVTAGLVVCEGANAKPCTPEIATRKGSVVRATWEGRAILDAGVVAMPRRR